MRRCLLQGYKTAAVLYRRCRQGAECVKHLNGAMAIRAEIPALHRDLDFEAVARNSDVSIHRL